MAGELSRSRDKETTFPSKTVRTPAGPNISNWSYFIKFSSSIHHRYENNSEALAEKEDDSSVESSEPCRQRQGI